MSPSVNELTKRRIALNPGDKFILHGEGAKRLQERHRGSPIPIEFKEGDILVYPGYKSLDDPVGSETGSVWMKKNNSILQVDPNADLFSEK